MQPWQFSDVYILRHALTLCVEMRKNIDKLVTDLEEDSESLEVIGNNLKNLDFVLNKIIYLKSHSVNMMFKDAIVLKKE